ncbi:MAG: DUF455 family protein [Planctomycetota bacterium]|nr:DUF455 family protein [Planctomycetota bacterium]
MELREHAWDILRARTLRAKLEPPPPGLTDEKPRPGYRLTAPVRPASLAMEMHRQAKVPPADAMHDPAQKIRILHALANHELQAAELFAWAILAFPDAPAEFRQGLIKIMTDEQRHCAMYVRRIHGLGGRFGAFPVSSQFWKAIQEVETPLQFICTMGLTFENANLDFAVEYIDAARAIGDTETARILEMVHGDEIGHVAFAWFWLERWKPAGIDAWATYCANVKPPLGPERARGATFDTRSRQEAGFDDAFIDNLRATDPTKPGGAPR